MSNWAAPSVVFSLGSTGALVAGAPEAIVFVALLALCGYIINKEESK